jgi:hypothetical protein
VYLWIWRRLPDDPRVKLLIAAAAVLVAGLVLWYVVFPWLEPKTQFDHGVMDGTPSPTPHR